MSERSAHLPQATLRSWITASLLASLVVAVVACAAVIRHIARQHAEQAARDTLTLAASGFRDGLDTGMAQYVEEVKVAAGLDQVIDVSHPEAVRRALDRLKQSFPHMTWIGLAGADGHVLASAGGLLEGADVSQRPWFAGAREGVHVGDVHAAVLLAKLLPAAPEPWRFVDVAVPVHDLAGRRVGTLAVHLSWAWAREVKDDLIEHIRTEHQADALVVARDGTVLLGPPALEGKRWIPDAAADMSVALPSQARGDFPGLGWKVVVRQPRAMALAAFDRLQRQIAVTALALALLSMPFSAWLARRISRPLHQLSRAIAEQHHLEDRALPQVSGYREAAVLSEALHELARRQQAQDDTLRQLNESLEQRVQERTEALQHTAGQLQASERLLRNITDNLPVLITYLDSSERLLFVNATFKAWMGFDAAPHLGKPLREVIGPQLYEQREAPLRQALAGERVKFELQSSARGVLRHLQNIYIPDKRPDGSVAGLYALSTDITAMKEVEQHLEALTRADPLTGLPNRRQFDERLQQAMARTERTGRPMALLFLDLDRFKQVNDTLGHNAGDELLVAVAARLGGAVRMTDTVARLAGDEFVVILEDLNEAGEAEAVAGKILEAIGQPMQLGGQDIVPGTSIGIAGYAGGPASATELLARADRALYEAKAAGRGTVRLAGDDLRAAA